MGNTKTGKVFRFPASCVLEPGRAIRVEVQQGDPEGASVKKADYVDSTSDGRGTEEVYYLLEYPYETPCTGIFLTGSIFCTGIFPTDAIFCTGIFSY